MSSPRDRVRFPWGRDQTRELILPAGRRVTAVLEPRQPTQVPDLAAELDRALANPVGLPPLHRFARPGQRACVVIDDRTRPTPVASILPAVLKELLRAGVREEDVAILIALGTHREMTKDEIKERVGPEAAGRYKIENHRLHDSNANVSVGRTPSDGIAVSVNRRVAAAEVVVTIGCIEAHEVAGFGGGYKNFLPGCAGPEAIRAIHHPRFQPLTRISHAGMPRGRSRVRRAIDEAGQLLGPKVFIVNAVLDPVRPAAIVAGDPREAHAAGAELYRAMAEVKLAGPADVIIANAAPLDLDLRVSMKACFNAAGALKPGGILITAAAAPEGLGDLRLPARLPRGAKNFIKKVPLPLLQLLTGLVNKSPDQAVGTISLLKLLKTAQAWLYLTDSIAGLDALAAGGIEFFSDPAALMARARELRPRAEAVVMPQAGASFIAWE